MFVDLAGFTALNEAHGDEMAASVLDDFCAVVRDVSERHGLREIKTIGDAFFLVSDDGSKMAEAAREIMAGIGARSEYPDARAGIHAGDVIERDGDVFGRTVNLAARVTAEAGPGQVLVTKEAADAAGLDPPSVGTRNLRNVPRPIELFSLSNRQSAQRARDPVCHMLLDPESAAGTYRHEGETLYFCSKDCLHQFLESPHSYDVTRDGK